MARVARSEDERLIIAYNIKKRRMQKYPASGKCAEDYGVPHSQWSPWESGKRTPDPKRLVSIAKFLGCNAKDLQTPPDNWPEEKKLMLAEQQRKRPNAAPARIGATSPGGKARPTEAADGGTAEYLHIVGLLTQALEEYHRGEIAPSAFMTKAKSVRDFINFTFHSQRTNAQTLE